MKVIAAILGVIVVGALAGLVVMYSGRPDVSVLGGHSKLVMWVLDQTMTNSVKHHANGITPPPLDNPAMLKLGFEHYDEMCVTCHGAPGVSRSEIGVGLHPEPPSLAAVMDDWTPAELFWITKNGVKMTGMPAFGLTHTDDQIWAIVAFVRTLPNLEPEDYLAMGKSFASPDTTVPIGRHELDDDHRHPE
jgi:mono/diheme cytochrome c family protein